MAKLEKATLGGGCFWCLEAAFKMIKGVAKVKSGYAGGAVDKPTYEQVSAGDTGHAEVVQITFDPKQISYQQLLEIFWAIHDPTTHNRQGSDVGPQYRSAIFYHNDAQKQLAEQSKATIQKLWPDPVVTEVKPLADFYPAEDYHQDYFAKNPTQSYCQIVINPKLEKLKNNYASLLK